VNLESAASVFRGGYALLAHQGGWDEILLVVLPLAAVGMLLYVANRQISAKLDAEQQRPVPDASDEILAPEALPPRDSPQQDSPQQQSPDTNQA
jgi:hypothetical protein